MRARRVLAALLGVVSVLGAVPAVATGQDYRPAGVARAEIGLDHRWRFQLGDPAGAHEAGFDDSGLEWWLDTGAGATEVFVDVGARDDHNASDGARATIHGPIAGTAEDEVYRTYRAGALGYRLPVANGSYVVTLKFASPSRAGADIFNVNAERQRMILGLDVAAEAGRNTALDKVFPVQVSDGVLDLEFVPQLGAASVAAISVAPRETP